MAYSLLKRGFKVRGLALISNTQGMPRYPEQDIIGPGIHIGDYAVALLYYHRLPADLGTTPEAARAEAERWANATYIPALRRRDQLTDAEKATLTAELARRLGLKPSDINPKTLGVTQGFFLGHVLPGKRVYYSDYRKEEPYTQPPLQAGVRYLRHELGYATDLPYLGVETYQDGFAPSGTYPKTVNQLWVHSTVYDVTPEQLAESEAAFEKTGAIGEPTFGPKLPGAAEAMDLSSKLKVLVVHGAYDPLGGCSMDAELGRRLPAPYHDAVTFRCYMSGHAVVRDPGARTLFANDMRALAKSAASGD